MAQWELGSYGAKACTGLKASVAILDIDRDAGSKSAAAIAKGGHICEFFPCNVSAGAEVLCKPLPP